MSRLSRSALVPLMLLIGFAIGSAGCAHEHRNRYASVLLEPAPSVQRKPSVLVKRLVQHFEDNDIRSVEIHDSQGRVELLWPRGKRNALYSLDRELLEVLHDTLTHGEPGMEFDRLAGRGRKTPVTVLWQLDSRVELHVGRSAFDPHRATANATGLHQAFGVTAVSSGAAQWTRAEYTNLHFALRRLKPEERELVRGMAFIRDDVAWNREFGAVPVQPPGYTANQRTGYTLITIYDVAASSNERSFCGDVKRPLSAQSLVMLQEIGHGISHLGHRRRLQIIDEHQRQVAELEEDLSMLTVESLQDDDVYADGETVADLRKLVQREIYEHKCAVQRRQRDVACRRAAPRVSPVAAAFDRVLPYADAITENGRTSPEASFADAFALHACDPDALKRISPTAWQFFEDGQHIEAAKRAIEFAEQGRFARRCDALQYFRYGVAWLRRPHSAK